MATFEYNVFEQTVYSGPPIDAFADFDPWNLNGSLTDGGGDDTFEIGDVIVWDTRSTGLGEAFVGTLTYRETLFAVFGPAGPLQPGATYYFFGYNDNPRGVFGDHTSDFVAASDIVLGAVFTTCFSAGTPIATPKGERTVETLRVGETILTADGRQVPVLWIGRQTLHRCFTPLGRFEPVRIRAGALGADRPHTDLVLTADHALILDGRAINAGALVNGNTIAHVPAANLPDRVTYYQVETLRHEAILAAGVPAETYVTYVGRRAFDNYRDYLARYGAERLIPEMALPRVSAARQLGRATYGDLSALGCQRLNAPGQRH
jgi:hypothetical protein